MEASQPSLGAFSSGTVIILVGVSPLIPYWLEKIMVSGLYIFHHEIWMQLLNRKVISDARYEAAIGNEAYLDSAGSFGRTR